MGGDGGLSRMNEVRDISVVRSGCLPDLLKGPSAQHAQTSMHVFHISGRQSVGKSTT